MFEVNGTVNGMEIQEQIAINAANKAIKVISIALPDDFVAVKFSVVDIVFSFFHKNNHV